MPKPEWRKKNKLFFESSKQLIAWLRGTKRGQQILERVLTLDADATIKERIWSPRYKSIVDEIAERYKSPVQHVIVEVFPDGWADVYAPRSVRVHVVKRPRTATIDLFDASLERLVEERIPYVARETYEPHNLRMRYDHSVPTLEEELGWATEQLLVREMLSAAKRGVVAASNSGNGKGV